MKIGELRKKLSGMKKEEVVKLAAEFYKLIPKNKKEDYDVDEMVDNPGAQKKKAVGKSASLAELGKLIPEFTKDARDYYYISPNRKIPKKERSVWRHKVKRWYNALIDRKRPDKDLTKQARLLKDLYELLCEACGQTYFSGYDPFQSVGVEQSVFYHSVITLLQEAEGKFETVRESIGLIVDNYLNRYTLKSFLMMEWIATLESSDLKYKGIEITKECIRILDYKPVDKNYRGRRWTGNYEQKRKHNHYVQLVFRLHAALFEYEEGIEFYNEFHQEENKEIQLFILVRILLEYQKNKLALIQIQKAIENGIQPRKSLIDLIPKLEKNIHP